MVYKYSIVSKTLFIKTRSTNQRGQIHHVAKKKFSFLGKIQLVIVNFWNTLPDFT